MEREGLRHWHSEDRRDGDARGSTEKYLGENCFRRVLNGCCSLGKRLLSISCTLLTYNSNRRAENSTANAKLGDTKWTSVTGPGFRQPSTHCRQVPLGPCHDITVTTSRSRSLRETARDNNESAIHYLKSSTSSFSSITTAFATPRHSKWSQLDRQINRENPCGETPLTLGATTSMKNEPPLGGPARRVAQNAPEPTKDRPKVKVGKQQNAARRPSCRCCPKCQSTFSMRCVNLLRSASSLTRRAFQIFSLVHPRDLLHISWTSKVLNRFLTSKSSRHVWQASFKTVPEEEQPPPCPSEMTEMAYTNLVYGRYCMVCE